MTTDDQKLVEDYMARLKAIGRSAPIGYRWHELYQAITRGFPENDLPKLPLILGGSMSSNEAKHSRLHEHLTWASTHGRLYEAFRYLDDVPDNGWDTGSAETWSVSSSWEDDE